MWIQSALVLTILMGCQTIQTTAEESIHKRMHVNFCSYNNTISVEIVTRSNEATLSCQCNVNASPEPSPKQNYVYARGLGAYKLHTLAKSWNEARKVCNEENAHLAIINSRVEEAFLVDILKKAQNSIRGGLNAEEALLGIHDLYKEGEWVTIFGESLFSTGYSYWSPTYWGGQPDNYGNNQNCGALINEGGMDDVTCTDKFAFFCELPLSC